MQATKAYKAVGAVMVTDACQNQF